MFDKSGGFYNRAPYTFRGGSIISFAISPPFDDAPVFHRNSAVPSLVVIYAATLRFIVGRANEIAHSKIARISTSIVARGSKRLSRAAQPRRESRDYLREDRWDHECIDSNIVKVRAWLSKGFSRFPHINTNPTSRR